MIRALLCAMSKRFHPNRVNSFFRVSSAAAWKRRTPTKLITGEANSPTGCQWIDTYAKERVALNIEGNVPCRGLRSATYL